MVQELLSSQSGGNMKMTSLKKVLLATAMLTTTLAPAISLANGLSRAQAKQAVKATLPGPNTTGPMASWRSGKVSLDRGQPDANGELGWQAPRLGTHPIGSVIIDYGRVNMQTG